ncbi:MAG: hypothetical protein OJF51_004687 [Nitrospira sp.]|nr:MAG: hypothetical protein OJF51_004687 [Nitrospira sp.]
MNQSVPGITNMASPPRAPCARGPSSLTSITDYHVLNTSLPFDTGTVSDGPRIEEAMSDQMWTGLRAC